MAFITLRQANVVTAPNATIKGSPLTNSEVDNNFANINIQVVDSSNTLVALDTAVQGLGTTINNLSSSAISNGTSSLTVLEDGDLIVTGNIVPSTNVAFNLGNVDFRFKDIFLSGNTIDLGGVQISVDGSSNLLFNSNVIATPDGFVNTGSIPDGSITADKLAADAVTNDKILDGTIADSKLVTAPFSTGKAIAMAIVFS